MDFDSVRVWIAAGIIAAVMTACFLVLFLSPQSRLERRRRRSNARVVSTARRPMVRFSVRVPKSS